MAELRAFAEIDAMQPQWAAYVAQTCQGDPPHAGMAQLVDKKLGELRRSTIALRAIATGSLRFHRGCGCWSRNEEAGSSDRMR